MYLNIEGAVMGRQGRCEWGGGGGGAGGGMNGIPVVDLCML